MGFVVASAFVLAATGCSDDDDDNGGNAGTGGSSGSGGKAGMSAGGSSGGKAGSPSGGKAGSNTSGSGNEAGTPDPGGGGAAGELPVGGAAGETGGGAAGEGLGGTGEGGAGGAPVALDCAQYCDWMQASCTPGPNQQYPDEAQCLQSCAAFPTTAGDNSFACRVGFAEQVSTDATNCDAAGPAGIGECGTPCEAYCNLMLTYCPHEADGASLTACMDECETVPENDITTFVYPAPGGDTLACRIAHATNAAKDTDPNGANRLLHCNHAAGDAAPCLDATP